MGKRARSPRLELRLNLSPPRAAKSSSVGRSLETGTSSSISTHSSEGSCVSSKADEETRAMLLVGCFRCLMYVMLSDVDRNPECPKCKSTVLLHFLNYKENTKKKTSRL